MYVPSIFSSQKPFYSHSNYYSQRVLPNGGITLWLHRVYVFVILCLVWTQKHGSERVVIQIPYLVCNFNASVVCNVFVQSPVSIYLERNKHVTLVEEGEGREAREGEGGEEEGGGTLRNSTVYSNLPSFRKLCTWNIVLTNNHSWSWSHMLTDETTKGWNSRPCQTSVLNIFFIIITKIKIKMTGKTLWKLKHSVINVLISAI